MAIPLEDNVGDIVGKAQRGLRIADSELAKKAAIGADQLRKIRDGELDEAVLRAVAPALNLDANALVAHLRCTPQYRLTIMRLR